MANEQDLAKGWTLEEALRQLVPNAWREWEHARDKSPSRPPRRGIVSDIYGSVPPSPEYIEKKFAWDAATKARRNLHSAFVELMSDGQNKTIILPNDAGADWRPIPSAQWRNVKRLDPENSCIRYKGDWLHVRVFLAVGSQQMTTDANLAKRLVGLTLAEAFGKIIVDDPVIRALAKNAIHDSPRNPFYTDSPGNPFLPNLETQSYGELIREWPVCTASWICLDGEWGLDLIPDATESDAKLIKGIADRYNMMMEPLRSGFLVGLGHQADGTLMNIHRGIWSNDDYHCDFVKSDVGKIFESDDGQASSRFTPVWTAVEIREPHDSAASVGKDAVTHSTDEPKLTTADRAIRAAVLKLYPKGLPRNLKGKEIENNILDEINEQKGSKYSGRSVRRYFEKFGKKYQPISDPIQDKCGRPDLS